MNSLNDKQRELHTKVMEFMASRGGEFAFTHENRVPVLRIRPSKDGRNWPQNFHSFHAPFRYDLDALNRVEGLLTPDELTRYCDTVRQYFLDNGAEMYLQRSMIAPPEIKFACLCVVLGFATRDEILLDVREASNDDAGVVACTEGSRFTNDEVRETGREVLRQELPATTPARAFLSDDVKDKLRHLATNSAQFSPMWWTSEDATSLFQLLTPEALLSLIDEAAANDRAHDETVDFMNALPQKRIVSPIPLKTKREGVTHVFLAGGITGCPDWQREVEEKVSDCDDIFTMNPRRINFDTSDESVVDVQITWEHTHLALADCVSFWFPCETLNPITLLELGACLYRESRKHLIIGVHPDYARRKDVEMQVKLQRPEIEVVYSLDALIARIRDFAEDFSVYGTEDK